MNIWNFKVLPFSIGVCHLLAKPVSIRLQLFNVLFVAVVRIKLKILTELSRRNEAICWDPRRVFWVEEKWRGKPLDSDIHNSMFSGFDLVSTQSFKSVTDIHNDSVLNWLDWLVLSVDFNF